MDKNFEIGKNREASIDILKIIACFSVVVLHFTEYYYQSTENAYVYIMLHAFRWFVFGCIGFFVLATGYLNCYKKIEKKYYKKLISIVITFLIFSILLSDGTLWEGLTAL